eukprot:2249560-Prymnesium_polylepis.1
MDGGSSPASVSSSDDVPSVTLNFVMAGLSYGVTSSVLSSVFCVALSVGARRIASWIFRASFLVGHSTAWAPQSANHRGFFLNTRSTTSYRAELSENAGTIV